MDIQLLSTTYEVRELGEQDIPTIFELYRGNPLYFHHCPPPASPEGVREDMTILPEGKTSDDKYYIGFWKEKELVAVMDLVLGYPDEKTAYIGLFMVNAEYQGKGYVQNKTYDYEKANGTTGTKLSTVWTQKGRLFLYNRLKEIGVVPEMEKEEVSA